MNGCFSLETRYFCSFSFSKTICKQRRQRYSMRRCMRSVFLSSENPLTVMFASSRPESRNRRSASRRQMGFRSGSNAMQAHEAEQGIPQNVNENENRVSDLILLAEQIVTKDVTDANHRAALVRSLYTDTSQCGSRKPWACGQIRCLTTSSSIYGHKAMRYLATSELFGLLGFEDVNLTSQKRVFWQALTWGVHEPFLV